MSMQVPIQITLRDDLPHTPAVDEHIKEKTDKLQQFCQNIISCHVVVELANKNHNHGNLYNTRITTNVPGKELVSTKNENENMYISIAEAFDDLTRQAESYNEQLKGHNGKAVNAPSSGKVVRLFEEDGFGFIEGLDGTEFYFNATHTNHSFNKLSIGTPVHFVETPSHDGPQARHVRIAEQVEN